MKATNKIKDFDVTLDELYKGDKQVLINLSDKRYQFHVVMSSNGAKPDCKLSSFGANLWFRTPKGINYQRYGSLSALQSALTRAIGDRIETSGVITYNITTDVSYL